MAKRQNGNGHAAGPAISRDGQDVRDMTDVRNMRDGLALSKRGLAEREPAAVKTKPSKSRQTHKKDALHDRAHYFLHLSSPVFVLNLEHDIVDANYAAADLVGWKREQLPGTSYYDVLDDPAGRAGACAAARAMKSGRRATDRALPEIAGRMVPLLVSAEPIVEDGRVTGVVQIFTDVSEEDRLTKEMLRVVNSIREGNLATRPNLDGFEERSKVVLNSIGELLDAFGAPLKVFAECTGRIARGDIPAPLQADWKGEFNLLKNSLNSYIESLTGLETEMARMSEEHNKGDIDVLIPLDKFPGAYRGMAQGVNELVGAHIAVNKKAMACVAGFGKGNFDTPLEQFPGKKAFINENIEELRESVRDFIASMARVAEEHHQGDIDVMIPVEKFRGAYRVMAQGVNEMVAGHITVKKKAMACVAEFGRGNFDAHLERFPGKKAFINDTIEEVRGKLKLLITEFHALSEAAVNGNLSARADETQHQGDFRKIVSGFNATLNSVMTPIKQVAEKVGAVSQSAGELIGVSQQMAGNAEETATQANIVSAASEQVTQNINTVSAATEQMQTSIREIAKNSNEAARVAKHAVEVAQTTNGTISKLGASSAEIGNVIKVITSIAQQTNLLALNATIEAARAGEAGKGFAVVANEVKELAKQTAKATEEISKKIEAIQTDTGGAVKAIDEIGGIINQINDITNSIAAAVEEQTVTTNEISRSVNEAASGSSEISRNISGVAMAAQGTTRGAMDSQHSAQALSKLAEQMQSVVGHFKV